jgi:hypothetical protein
VLAEAALELREDEMESRSFAKIFFNMTGFERVSVVETSPFATPEIPATKTDEKLTTP